MTRDGESLTQVRDDLSHEMGPSFLSDGKKISFSSDRTGRFELYVVTQNQTGWSEPEQITFGGCSSAKGSYFENTIAFISDEGLRIINVDNKEEKILVESHDSFEIPRPRFPMWSMDGKIVYYSAVDSRGIESIWAVPVEGGEPELKIISDDSYFRLALMGLSTDSRRFYFPMRLIESNVWTMDLMLPK